MNMRQVRCYALRRLGDYHAADEAAAYAAEYHWLNPTVSPRIAAAHGVRRVQSDCRTAARAARLSARVIGRATVRMDSIEHIVADLPATLADTARLLASGCTQSAAADVLGVSRECMRQRCQQIAARLA